MKITKYTIVCATLLVGCAPEVAEWTPAESPKKNLVDRATFKHSIHYPAHAEKMSEREKKSLKLFLQKTVMRPSAVTVILDEYGGHSEKRIKDVERELLRFGIPYELITANEEYEGHHTGHSKKGKHRSTGSGIHVTIERYVVIPPSCADFSNPNEWSQSYKSSNFGCSDESALGMMVANPRDLVRGRTLEGSSGKVMADGVKRYLDDKVKALPDTSTNVAPGSTQNTSTSSTSLSSTGGGVS